MSLTAASQAAAAPNAASQPSATAPKVTCPVVVPVPATEADTAARKHRYSEAETLYRADMSAAGASADARAAAAAGLIHALISDGKVREALAAATAALAAFPKNDVVLEAVGSAYYRHGETTLAAINWNAAVQANYCNPRVHYDFARYMQLNGLYASQQRQLAIAHQLDPDNRTVASQLAPKPSAANQAAARVAYLREQLAKPDLPAAEREPLQRSLDVALASSKGSCHIVTPTASAKVPLMPISNGPNDMYGVGLDVQLNGKRHRLEVDTGASGLLLSKSAAASAHIVPEATSFGVGIGDNGLQRELLAHVDDIKIGSLEFQNCLVRVFDKRDALETDGLIGADVFSNYVVTLDIPSREMRLDPLPPLPDDQQANTTELDTAGGEEDANVVPRDRYIAPSMKDWTKVFRFHHMLIFPTQLNNGPSRLFLMDTGASAGAISPEAAREVTKVSGSDLHVRGVSGEVANVSQADRIKIQFANVAQNFDGLTSFDTSSIARASGVEVSGLIGFPTLRELIISIDYRDNLVKVVYDPKHGFHARP